MNKLSIYQQKEDIFSLLQKSYQQNKITQSELVNYHHQLEILSKELVLYYNHTNSTSISKENYHRIWETMNYMLIHGLPTDLSLNQSIKEYFYQGLSNIKKDVETIKKIYQKIKKTRLPIQNDLYESIIDEQFVAYLHSLNQYHGIFNYCHLDYDYDYPLMNGYPFEHNMYNLQGSDFLLYYIKRFYIENKFCFLYHSSLQTLIEQYQEQKQISFSDLSINLFSLILNQVLINELLNKDSILLEKNDLIRIKRQFFADKIEKNTTLAIHKLSKKLSADIYSYIIQFKSQIIYMMKQNIQYPDESFIYPIDKNIHQVQLNPTKTSKEFNTILSNLFMIEDITMKIEYIKTLQINLHDLIDLFDHQIFYEEEYLTYYQSLSKIDIALLIKTILSDQHGYHLSKIEDGLDSSIKWQYYLIQYLQINKLALEIEEILDHIKLI
ncbi:MAG: DUF6179 domain-containing protein [Traorella sp.]